MKALLFGVMLIILVGCGSTTNISTYRPVGSTEAAWQVRAEKNNLTDKIQIYVNDSLVTEGSIGLFNSGEELRGEYRGHKVVAMIQKTSSLLSEGITCLVLIGGEIAGKFEF